MDLEKLAKIQRVDAPPFLFTRIQLKIAQENSEPMPLRTVLAINLSFALLLALNSVAIANYLAKPIPTENYVETFNLTSNNSLYK
ncbi:MAG: hypothetical protein HOP11_04480 [Saprospiraceae bacterium]|nr:hypothetical protein [Saprospiraceae bacterium]